MAWHNQIGTGGFTVGSDEWKDNIDMIRNQLAAFGWSDAAIAGLCGNLDSESSTNPWAWENPDYTGGYGLVQYTPASGYIGNSQVTGFPGYGPSVGGAAGSANDGTAQLYAINQNIPAKWYPTITVRQEAAQEHGVWDMIKGLMDYDDFKKAADPYAAAMAWLYWYEYPGSVHPGGDPTRRVNRNNTATAAAYEYITGHDPGPAPTPTPGTGTIPYGAIRDLQRRILEI